MQAEILRRLRPDGRGVTVVGDDAQAIYSFRAASRRQHPGLPRPVHAARGGGAAGAKLPLDAADPGRRQRGDRAGRPTRFDKQLRATRAGATSRSWPRSPTRWRRSTTSSSASWSGARPGVALRQQAVLFRSSHHSDALEVELGPTQHPLREVRRSALPRGGARQGRAGLPALGREPARQPGGVSRRAAVARHGAAPGGRAAAPRDGLRPAACRRRWPASSRRRRRAPTGRRWSSCIASCATRRRRGRRRWGWCAGGTSRIWSGSTTTRACAWAIWNSWSSWPPPRPRASASSPT